MAKKHLSVRKRERQNERRRMRNAMLRSAMRTAVKKVRLAVAQGDVEAAKAALPEAIRMLWKAKSKGVIHRNHAARKTSRLTRQVRALAAARA
ncbi:MAG: 30S ribosomal protein S20 [Candidatus Tectimicrobiota bacterium]|nr:MAG: 30S ribosomal protein S20 [Candidatus Tectomicrobia bacterium]